MKKILSVGLLAIIALTLNAQEKDPVLLTVGGKDVKLSEFNAIYHKNNTKEKATKESVQEYLDLYIKFKLKVREAEDLGFDTIPKFINELKGYRTQLAEPYLTDKEVTEELIKEAYERMKWDIRASHILVSIKDNASPSDTLVAFKKIMNARKRVLSGEDFSIVAKSVSEDPSAKKNGGDLGYFSVFHMVYPFESAAYNTKVGDVSMPIRTRFGYHIVKSVDKRKARGTITVAHIMIKHNTSAKEADNRKKIDEIYDKLTKEDGDFAALANKYSDDKNSARQGGALPEFNAGKMVAAFENAAFLLKKDGEISKPIKTEFGWHIIKRHSLKELETYDELYKRINAKVARDSRANKSKDVLLSKIKANNNFKEYLKERQDFYKLIVAKEYVIGKFKSSSTSDYKELMFGFYANDGEKYEFTQVDFSNYIEKNYTKGLNAAKFNVENEINRLYAKVVAEKAIAFKDSRLSKTNQEFRLLIKEYRDGILLFDLTDEKVWSKAVKDSTGMYDFYQKNKSNYMWGERAKAVIYSCSDDKVAGEVEKLVKKKSKKGYTNKAILEMINVDSQLTLKIDEDKYSKGDNDYVDASIWKKGEIYKSEKEDAFTIVEIENILAAEPKKIAEIKGLITSDYQNYLEKEWIESLQAKYKVEVDTEVLKLVK